MLDYYQVLKIPKNASLKEIQRAYRHLAHIHHPDKQGGNLANFIAVSKAYEVLSDPDTRRRYDEVAYSETTNTVTYGTSTRTLDPHLCQSCGKRAPLKAVSFSQNIGLLFSRQSKTISGRFCKECIETYFWKYTLITFIGGWWGVISFFVTIGYLFSNILVFIKSLSLKSGGHDKSTKFFAWRISSEFFAWCVLVLVLGSLSLFVISLVNSESSSEERSQNTNPVPVAESAAQKLGTQVDQKPSKDPKTYVSLSNGTVLYEDGLYFNGLGELTITNGTENDAIAKLININKGKSIYTVYIKANSDFEIKNISDADYKLFFNLGNDWNDVKGSFEENFSYEVFEDVFDYRTTDEDYTIFRVTLNPTIGGRAETTDVSSEEFGEY